MSISKWWWRWWWNLTKNDDDAQHDVIHINKTVSIFYVLAYKTNLAYSHPVGWLWINYWFNITTVLEILCMLTYRYRKKIENKIKTFCLVWEITVFVDVKRCNTFLSLRHLRSVLFSMENFFLNEKGKFSMRKGTKIKYSPFATWEVLQHYDCQIYCCIAAVMIIRREILLLLQYF